jgi:SCY1-like protein 1
MTPIIPESHEHGVSNRKSTNNWGDTEFEPLEEQLNVTNCKLEEAKKKREERKLMRQKELEARRASRSTGGPMKLGAKKM